MNKQNRAVQSTCGEKEDAKFMEKLLCEPLSFKTRSRCSREQRALFGELDLVRCVLLQLVGKRYPLKAVRTLKKNKREEEISV